MWYNKFVQGILHSPLHAVLSGNTFEITYQGHLSGKPYTLPVNFYSIKANTVLVISRRDRVWWRNLRGGAPIKITHQRQTYAAYAEPLEDNISVIHFFHTLFIHHPELTRAFGVKDFADVPKLTAKWLIIYITLDPAQHQQAA